MGSDARPVLVIGAGGHAKVVVSTLQAAGFEVVGILDDDSSKHGALVLGVRVEGTLAELGNAPARLAVIGIGDNHVRQAVAWRFPAASWATVIHPQAFVHPSVKLGAGTVVFAGAVIQPDAVLGAHVIINTRASIDHDCEVGDFVHVGPGVSMSGGVRVGEGALLGIGSAVIPYRKVGKWAKVGGGSVVIHDVQDGATAVGVPAHVVRGNTHP
jgi:sugar O-acyltransferase (sialic acid O-acetyltransferase NeuD family)